MIFSQALVFLKGVHMATYRYEGAVQVFEKLVDPYWKAETIAPTPQRARSNLAYRFKRENGLAATAKVTLVGKIQKID